MKQQPDADPTLSIFEKILYLQRGPTTRGSDVVVSAGQLSVVADQMRERTFKAGSVLMLEGESPAAAYSLVRGRVQVSRRGQVLGEVGPGAVVGFGAIVSRDVAGLGAVATADTLALELDVETLGDIFDDHFPFLLEAIRETSRRHLGFIRSMTKVPEPVREKLFSFTRMGLVERLLLLRMPGGPFERSSVDALAEVAQLARYRSIEAGTTLWKEGDRAGEACLIVNGTISCISSRGNERIHFRAHAGGAIGALESIAGQPRWHDAVAETHVDVLEHDVDDVIDVFEDNVEMAIDYLTWVSTEALNLIETTFGPGPELLNFFTGSWLVSHSAQSRQADLPQLG